MSTETAWTGPGWYQINFIDGGEFTAEFLEKEDDEIMFRLPDPPLTLVDHHAGKSDRIVAPNENGDFREWKLAKQLSYSPDRGWLCKAFVVDWREPTQTRWIPATEVFQTFWWTGPGWYRWSKDSTAIEYFKRLPGSAVWERLADPLFEEEEIVSKKGTDRYKAVKALRYSPETNSWQYQIGTAWEKEVNLISLGQAIKGVTLG